MKNKSNKWQSEIPNKDGLYWLDSSDMFDGDTAGILILDIYGGGKYGQIHGSGGSFLIEDLINTGLHTYRITKIEFVNKWMSCKNYSKNQSRICQIKSHDGYVGAGFLNHGNTGYGGFILWDNHPTTRSISGFRISSNTDDYNKYKLYPIKPPPFGWSVYMIKSSKDNSIYTGISNNVQARIQAHNKKQGAKYTKTRTPFTLIYEEYCGTKSSASKREYAIKQLTRKQKDKLILNKEMQNG